MARKILLADDSVTAQNMGRKILTDAGYDVITVNNGSAALKKIAEGKPDLIVLDVYMPGYSGLEVCQRIKENRETSRIPILLTVGKLEPFKPEEARRARADAFVVKPFEASELLAALTKLEDKIVPQPEPYKQGRFARAVASVDQESPEKFGDSDEGWKARLRIPVGPPKPRENDPPVDYAATQGKGFRDFVEPPARKTPPKPAVASTFERPAPAGVPHDITPEEIAAITAAAAQLSGPAAAVAPPVEHGVKTEVSTEFADSTVPAVVDVEASDESPEDPDPVTFASAPEIETQEPPAVEVMEAVSAPEDQKSEAEPPAEMLPSAAQEPAPAATIEPAMPTETTEPIASETLPAAEVAKLESQAESASSAAIEAAPDLPPPVVQANPADDEVMAALQALIPPSDTPDTVALASAGPHDNAALVVSSTTSATPGSRWIAEEITLAADEVSASLEAEMQQAHTTASAEASPAPVTSPADAVAESAVAPLEPDSTTVYAMATAAAAGEAASLVAAISAPLPEEPPTVAAMDSAHEVAETIAPSTPQPQLERSEVETEIPGGSEIMAANWKNIRDSIAGAAAKPAPAKEEFDQAEPVKSESAKLEADAIAPAAKEKTPVTDAKAIASIVDSVLAELRPKIVEEIARKLGDPKKD